MNNNIIFSFEESELNLKNNYDSIQQMMNEIEEEDLDLLNLNLFNMNTKLDKFSEFTEYNNYTVKELLKICNYYDIDNNIKNSKCKKQDIISTIQYYESLPENIEIVQKRKTMWFYIEELLNDSKMKKYVILF
jgi:hypothetical protein